MRAAIITLLIAIGFQAQAQLYLGGNTTAYGFTDEQFYKIAHASNLIAINNIPLVIRGQEIYPNSHVFYTLNALVPDASNGCNGNCEAYVDMSTQVAYLTPYLLRLTAMYVAGALVHEADHPHYGGHTCGTDADADDSGAYGTEAYFQARASQNKGLTFSQRVSARARADAISRYQMCHNAEAFNRIQAALNLGEYP